jgi:hypothetical protein
MNERVRVAGSVLLGLGLAMGAGSGAAWSQAGGDAGQNAPPAMAMGGGRMIRGTVTAVAGDKVTLKTESGETFQVALTANTRIMKGREPAKAADVHIGDGIGAMGEMDQQAKTVHALVVTLVDAEQVKKMKESYGKTWISGKVTAIDDLKLTILRSDNVSQVIAVTEDTSFKKGGRGMQMAMQGDGAAPLGGGNWGGRSGNGGARGSSGGPPPDAGESITLADIKVGDNVAGQGALKNGVFIPTTLAVSDPAQQRRRRPAADGTPAAASATTPPAGPK